MKYLTILLLCLSLSHSFACDFTTPTINLDKAKKSVEFESVSRSILTLVTKEFCSHCQCCLSQPRKTTSKTPFLRFKTQVKGMPKVLSQYIVSSISASWWNWKKSLSQTTGRICAKMMVTIIYCRKPRQQWHCWNEIRPNVDSGAGRGIPCTNKQSKIKNIY